MITTVATSTVTSSSIAALAGGSLGAIAVVALILLLLTKELTSQEVESGRAGERVATLAKHVVIPIIPLLLAFSVIVAVKVWEVLVV